MRIFRFILQSVTLAALALYSLAAHADLPLTVEDLITDKGKFRLSLSVAYANQDRHGLATGEPTLIQTGEASFVSIPGLVGENHVNSDTLVVSLGLRYGLSERAEIYTRLSGLASQQRNRADFGTSASHSEARLVDAWLGVNYQFLRGSDAPALLGFAELALSERQRSSSAHLRSAMLGLTTYYAIDPVVFALTAAYRFNQNRRDGALDLRPGNLWLFNPSLAFAVNDRVTLTTGVQWTHRGADEVNGRKQGIDRTATDLLLGVGYGIARGNTLNTVLKVNASGRAGSELRVNWLYTF